MEWQILGMMMSQARKQDYIFESNGSVTVKEECLYVFIFETGQSGSYFRPSLATGTRFSGDGDGFPVLFVVQTGWTTFIT